MSQTSPESTSSSNPLYRDSIESIRPLLAQADELPAVSGLDTEYLANDSPSRFYVEKTPFPDLSRDDIEEGVFLYRPTSPVDILVEITGSPPESPELHGKVPARFHWLDDGEVRTMDYQLYVQQVLIEFTYVPAEFHDETVA